MLFKNQGLQNERAQAKNWRRFLQKQFQTF
jgi:hypothetical protein